MNWLLDVLPPPVTDALVFAAENAWVWWTALGISALCFLVFLVRTGEDF